MSDAYERSMALNRYLVDGGRDMAEIERLWRETFEAFLIANRFTRKSIDYMWDCLALGNWKHLWQTDEEKERTTEEWLEWFRIEVWYCSDRWNLDRLIRCHWAWRQYKRKAEE